MGVARASGDQFPLVRHCVTLINARPWPKPMPNGKPLGARAIGEPVRTYWRGR